MRQATQASRVRMLADPPSRNDISEAFHTFTPQHHLEFFRQHHSGTTLGGASLIPGLTILESLKHEVRTLGGASFITEFWTARSRSLVLRKLSAEDNGEIAARVCGVAANGDAGTRGWSSAMM